MSRTITVVAHASERRRKAAAHLNARSILYIDDEKAGTLTILIPDRISDDQARMLAYLAFDAAFKIGSFDVVEGPAPAVKPTEGAALYLQVAGRATRPEKPITEIRAMGEIAGMEGMTLRQYYAGQALAGITARSELDFYAENTAAMAVQMADALIAELAK